MKPLPNDQTASSSAPDAELVRAARAGDRRAFVEIVARHQAMVCGVALGILGDFAAGEDAAQEAFLTAWRKLNELKKPERLRAWLAQIARNAALGHLRRRRDNHPLEVAPDLPDDAPAPDEIAAHEEELALVRDTLLKLPENYRLPLILFYREGQSVRAVAETLELSEDAVKQRLARGREMLRDRISGLVETVLTRTTPNAIFTMTVAAAIGALAAPPALAGSVFAASSAAGATSSTASTSFLTAMSTSKTCLIAATLVAAACIPAGYYVARETAPAPPASVELNLASEPVADESARSLFADSALIAKWRLLHEVHGTTADAMPALYKAITGIQDPFRRRGFRAALMAEWVQVDPEGGLAFFLREGDSGRRRQFFEEWLALEPRAAVDALMTAGPGWEKVARDCLIEIARRIPSRVLNIAPFLPNPDNYWDTRVRDAFAIVAESGLASARTVAEALTGPHCEQALAGVAQVWSKSDLEGAIAWARSLPDGVDRDEIIRAALIGRAAVDPWRALESNHAVSPGGRQSHFASTTGARVLAEAAKADYDLAVAWLNTNPSRFGPEDMLGMAQPVTERLNEDPIAFLSRHAGDGSLGVLLPAIDSAILNDAAGQRATIWEWLKTQPDADGGEPLDLLKRTILNSAGYQDPNLAVRLVEDLPRTEAGDAQVQSLAFSLLNGGRMLHRFDRLLEEAPERLREPLIHAAFQFLRGNNFDDPQLWIARLSLMPEALRARGVESVARAWAERTPEEAIGWAAFLNAEDERTRALAAITSTWAGKDAHGAASWIASMSPGSERDHSAAALVLAIADKHPYDAWDWAMSIRSNEQRERAAARVALTMAGRDPATARQWIESGPFAQETRAKLQSALENPPGRSAPQPTEF